MNKTLDETPKGPNHDAENGNGVAVEAIKLREQVREGPESGNARTVDLPARAKLSVSSFCIGALVLLTLVAGDHGAHQILAVCETCERHAH
jgi:hypothetical protein